VFHPIPPPTGFAWFVVEHGPVILDTPTGNAYLVVGFDSDPAETRYPRGGARDNHLKGVLVHALLPDGRPGIFTPGSPGLELILLPAEDTLKHGMTPAVIVEDGRWHAIADSELCTLARLEAERAHAQMSAEERRDVLRRASEEAAA
jgi:hypothetical protein